MACAVVHTDSAHDVSDERNSPSYRPIIFELVRSPETRRARLVRCPGQGRPVHDVVHDVTHAVGAEEGVEAVPG